MTNLFDLVRTGDPWTSWEAAAKVLDSTPECARQVWRAFAWHQEDEYPDGITDEWLYRLCAKRGYFKTPDRIRHGRLVLSRAGIIKENGYGVTTQTGCKARRWVINKDLG